MYCPYRSDWVGFSANCCVKETASPSVASERKTMSGLRSRTFASTGPHSVTGDVTCSNRGTFQPAVIMAGLHSFAIVLA